MDEDAILRSILFSDEFIQKHAWQAAHLIAAGRGSEINSGNIAARPIVIDVGYVEEVLKLEPKKFIVSAFTTLLGRHPDEEAVNFFQEYIQEHGKAGVLRAIIDSDEFKKESNDVLLSDPALELLRGL